MRCQIKHLTLGSTRELSDISRLKNVRSFTVGEMFAAQSVAIFVESSSSSALGKYTPNLCPAYPR